MMPSCNLQASPCENAKPIVKFMNGRPGMLAAVMLFGGLAMDVVYLAIAVGFFALSWGLIVFCEKL